MLNVKLTELLYELLDGLLILLHELLLELLVLLLHLLHRLEELLCGRHVVLNSCSRTGTPGMMLSRICRRVTLRTRVSGCVTLSFACA